MFVTDTNLNTSVGVVLSYTCHKYYEPFGEMMCQNDATWSIFGCDRSSKNLFQLHHPHLLVFFLFFIFFIITIYTCNQYCEPFGEMMCQNYAKWSKLVCERSSKNLFQLQHPHLLLFFSLLFFSLHRPIHHLHNHVTQMPC